MSLAWVATAVPAYFVGGRSALWGSMTAALLCFLPCAGSYVWQSWGARLGGNHELAGTAGGMMVRMFVVLGGGTLLNQLIPAYDLRHFLIWLMLYYLVGLGVEVYLLASPTWPGRPPRGER